MFVGRGIQVLVELGQTITAGIEGVAEIKFPNVKRR